MRLPYLVAEIGLHHGGDLELAKTYIAAAATAGANAAKFQHVVGKTLVTADAPTYFHQEGEQAQTQRQFFERVPPFTPEQYAELAAECTRVGIDFGCTVFTPEDVAWLDPLVKWHKVASADITNEPLLWAIGETGKPIYLSTGAATEDEIRRALQITGWGRTTLLHCVLSYPTPVEYAALGGIQRIRSMVAGYSDHTLFNLDVLTTAWLLGATVIEKHFTLDKALPGGDHYHSMDPTDLRALVAKLKELQAMIGDGEKRILPCEESARQHARRGLYAARDIPLGKVLEPADIAILRPSARLGPEQYVALIGSAAEFARLAGEAL